jgi:hypothetical protein
VSADNSHSSRAAQSCGLDAVPILKQSIWEQGEEAIGIPAEELRHQIDRVRQEVGPPWAEGQKLAALAAWIALARSS